MPRILPQNGSKRADTELQSASTGGPWAAAILLVPVALWVLSGTVPPALVLPALSVLTVITGLAVAGCTWLAQLTPSSLSDQRFDLAGGLLLIGFGASMMTDAPEALRSLAELQASLSVIAPSAK